MAHNLWVIFMAFIQAEELEPTIIETEDNSTSYTMDETDELYR